MLYNPNFNCTEFNTIRNAAGRNKKPGLSELSFRNNIPRVTKITLGVFKFLFGVIVNTFGETISIYNIGCQSPVPVAS